MTVSAPQKPRPPRSPRPRAQVSVSYGRCEVFVQGLDINCPLCLALVKSGQRHECSTLAKAI